MRNKELQVETSLGKVRVPTQSHPMVWRGRREPVTSMTGHEVSSQIYGRGGAPIE